MAERAYTIGQISRLSGIPVRRIRFYDAQGLLPRLARTQGGYRLFDEADLARLGLIAALRDAGLGLEAIRAVFARRRSVGEVLALRLAEIEAQIEAQRRIAAAIRMALREAEPTTEDLRRIWTMTTVSKAEHAAVMERFLECVAAGGAIDPRWKDWMLRMSAPNLPDDPTADQLDAWMELSALLMDAGFLEKMRRNAEDSVLAFDHTVYKTVSTAILARAEAAMEKGLAPDSPEGQAIAEDYIKGWARATGTGAAGGGRARLRRKQLEHRPNMERYWQLVTRVNGLAQRTEPSAVWLWIDRAASLRLAAD